MFITKLEMGQHTFSWTSRKPPARALLRASFLAPIKATVTCSGKVLSTLLVSKGKVLTILS